MDVNAKGGHINSMEGIPTTTGTLKKKTLNMTGRESFALEKVIYVPGNDIEKFNVKALSFSLKRQ